MIHILCAISFSRVVCVSLRLLTLRLGLVSLSALFCISSLQLSYIWMGAYDWNQRYRDRFPNNSTSPPYETCIMQSKGQSLVRKVMSKNSHYCSFISPQVKQEDCLKKNSLFLGVLHLTLAGFCLAFNPFWAVVWLVVFYAMLLNVSITSSPIILTQSSILYK